ncbi:MAG: MarR family transcriptional regulator [Pseudonocardia sp. SCN 73-27]|nr:MAG: MarR family transcriptional regulator [Pseudonocardia sp. SCN 72-51]ODV05324.1 MAG: MarR family transcriptional regulator [Pseudonocardia sp. SCN 73-27]
MTASRVMVAVAARSVAAVDDDVTLPQYRALVVLAQRGGLRPADLAHLLAVNRSTASRMCERLVGKGLVERDRSDADRREVALTLTERGRALVDDVTRRRREELRTLVTAMSADARDGLVTALRAFADTAGEPGEPDWAVVL